MKDLCLGLFCMCQESAMYFTWMSFIPTDLEGAEDALGPNSGVP